MKTTEVCRKHGISRNTFYKWKARFGGLDGSDARKLIGRLRDELLNEEVFGSLADARRKLAVWRHDYNSIRPHSALNGDKPADARRALERVEGCAPGACQPIDDALCRTRTLLMSEGAKGRRSCRVNTWTLQ